MIGNYSLSKYEMAPSAKLECVICNQSYTPELMYGGSASRQTRSTPSTGESKIASCKFCHQAEEIKKLKAQLTHASSGPPNAEAVNADTRLLAVQLELESMQKLFCEFKDMINSELESIKETAKSTQTQVNELQVQLDSELAKKLTALDAETNDRIKTIGNSSRDSEALYSTVVKGRQPSSVKAPHVRPLSPLIGTATHNRFDVLPDEMDSQNTEEIIVIGDYNVTSLKSNQKKRRVQLKVLGKPDLTIDETEGLIKKEQIPSSKPIILQIGAKDVVAQTEKIWRKYETMLKSIKLSHKNLHVTGILPHPNQSRYKSSKMIYLNNRLATFCETQQISFSDHWETMIDQNNYDFNRITNKARLNTYGLDTLENIFQNIGAGLAIGNKSKNVFDIHPPTPPVLPDGMTQRPPPGPVGIVDALPMPEATTDAAVTIENQTSTIETQPSQMHIKVPQQTLNETEEFLARIGDEILLNVPT